MHACVCVNVNTLCRSIMDASSEDRGKEKEQSKIALEVRTIFAIALCLCKKKACVGT